MDHWALIDEGQLMLLDDALNGKPFEGEGTWRDTFDPGLLKIGQMEGKTWVLPYFYSVLGWWYDPGVFKKNGWTPPKTFDELLVLGEKIKAAGMAPITFQGKYPFYVIDGMILPWICSAGGPEAIKACQNLEPGAWSSPAVLKAAQMIDELRAKGFFQRGAVGMTHTESEQQFLQGKAAMVPCGTWLKAEMQDSMPAGSAMRFMLPPVIAGGAGDPSSVIIKIEPWMVPAKAKNPDGAIALYKQMTSLTNAKRFVEEKGTLMAIKGSDQVKLTAELEEPARVMRESKNVYAALFREWYQTLGKELEDSTTALINGTITPEQFCARVEKKAQEVAKDDSILKHKVD
jgi:N-acetylglucosamine transport system substrate-binding protein